jgi:hypothetical protein
MPTGVEDTHVGALRHSLSDYSLFGAMLGALRTICLGVLLFPLLFPPLFYGLFGLLLIF